MYVDIIANFNKVTQSVAYRTFVALGTQRGKDTQWFQEINDITGRG